MSRNEDSKGEDTQSPWGDRKWAEGDRRAEKGWKGPGCRDCRAVSREPSGYLGRMRPDPAIGVDGSLMEKQAQWERTEWRGEPPEAGAPPWQPSSVSTGGHQAGSQQHRIRPSSAAGAVQPRVSVARTFRSLA